VGICFVVLVYHGCPFDCLILSNKWFCFETFSVLLMCWSIDSFLLGFRVLICPWDLNSTGVGSNLNPGWTVSREEKILTYNSGLSDSRSLSARFYFFLYALSWSISRSDSGIWLKGFEICFCLSLCSSSIYWKDLFISLSSKLQDPLLASISPPSLLWMSSEMLSIPTKEVAELLPLEIFL